MKCVIMGKYNKRFFDRHIASKNKDNRNIKRQTFRNKISRREARNT